MPHIVFSGQRIAISDAQLVEVKDGLRHAAAAGEPAEFDLLDAEGNATWVLWTPGAPIVVNDGEIPPLPEIPMPDFSSLGLPGFGEPPQQQRRVGF